MDLPTLKSESLLYSNKKIFMDANDNTRTDLTNKSNILYKKQHEKIIGNYILEKLINKGEISKVVLAKHIITGEKVAIKILYKKLFKNNILSLKHIKREIQILKIVKHENIINLLDIIDEKNEIYLITEYCPYDLFSLIIKNRNKKLSEESALNYFSQYINGLHYLHQNGISHRNLRPDNILLDEKKEKIKIIDFGLSTTYSKNQLLNSPVGAINYAPPEMHLSEKYSGELSDIWNAGLVLYFMVCGYLPFCEEDEEKNIKHIITGFYEIPSNISNHCAEIIKSCLQVDPNKRINFERLNKIVNFTKGLMVGMNLMPIDENIVFECKKYLGNSNNEEIIEKIKESVKNNKYNELNALYYLVLKKMKKNGYISISDFSSDKFKYYINHIEPKNETVLVYKQKKLSSYFLQKNSDININRSYNNYLLSIPSCKNQIIYSPMIIKNHNNKRYSSIGRNSLKVRNLINKNENDSLISCKNIKKTKIKLDEISYNNKTKNIRSISPKLSFNRKKNSNNNLSKNYFVKKKLLNSYSTLKNKRLNKEIIVRYNTTDNNYLESNTFNSNSTHIINSKILTSMKYYKDKREGNSIKNNNTLFFKSQKAEQNGKSMEFCTKKNFEIINKNKTIYNNKNYNSQKFHSEKNDYFNKNKNVDENNELINILTEDKPLESFNINFNLDNNSINSDRTEKITKIIEKYKNDINFHKYNDYYYNPISKKNLDISGGHKLKVRKNTITRGISAMLKNGLKIKKFLSNNNNSNLKNENNNKNSNNNLSTKRSLKIIDTNSNNNNLKIQLCNNGSKLINNKSYNKNFIHKKNKSALLNNIFDYKNKPKNEKIKENYKFIENGNSNNNEIFKNKKNKTDVENYETGIYDIGVIDLSCLKIETEDKMKQKIKKVLKNKKINYNYDKTNKYKCSKFGNFFDIEIFTLEKFLSINNGYKIKNNEKGVFIPLTKRNIQNKKSLFYLNFHIKKNDMKKSVNSILKEIAK